MSDFIIDIIEIMLKHLEEGAMVDIREIQGLIELIDETPENIPKIEDFEFRLRLHKIKKEIKLKEELKRAYIIDIQEKLDENELRQLNEEDNTWWNYITSWFWWK